MRIQRELRSPEGGQRRLKVLIGEGEVPLFAPPSG